MYYPNRLILKLLFFGAFLFVSPWLKAQFFSFEGNGCPFGSCFGIIDNGCMDPWESRFGSPYFSLTATDLNWSLELQYDTEDSEGHGDGALASNLDFDQGTTYFMTVDVLNNGPAGVNANLFFHLSNNVAADPAPGTPCFYEIGIPTDLVAQVNAQSLPNNQWQTLAFCFTPSSNFSQFNISTKGENQIPGQGSQGLFLVDRLHISEAHADFSYTNSLEDCQVMFHFEALELDPAYTYNWYVDEVLAGTGQTFDYALDPCATYQVKHCVAITPDCEACATQTVSTFWDDLAHDVVLGDPNTTYLLSDLTGTTLPDNSWSDFSIRINGTLVVDEDYSFDNGLFTMGPGALIYVNNDADNDLVQFDNCCLHGACQQLWQGIRVGETETLAMDYCQISDAEYAVNPLNRALIDIAHTDFDRNYIGLYHNSTQGGFCPAVLPQQYARLYGRPAG